MKFRSCVPLSLFAFAMLIAPVVLADDVPAGIDAQTWQHIESSVAAQVDAEIGAGEDSTLRGGLEAVHGLIRRHVLIGDYAGLPPQDAPQGPEFGFSVAIDGDWMAVGAPGTVWTDTLQGTAAHGAVYVFHRQGGNWILRQRLMSVHASSGGQPGSRCGHAVALHVPHLVFGCPEMLTAGEERAGRTYLYGLDGTSFAQRISVGGPAAGGRCGAALAISRDFLAIGCPTTGGDAGHVRVFRRNDNNTYPLGAPEAILIPGADVFGFGWSLALRQGSVLSVLEPWTVRLAIGAPTTVYPGTIWPRGSVFVYDRPLALANWSLASIMRPAPSGSDGAVLAQFGAAVAMNRNQLLIGAPNNRWGGIQTLPGPGTTHHYRLDNSGGPWTWQHQSNSGPVNLPDGGDNGMRFGAAIALGFDFLIAVGAPGVPSIGGVRPEVGLAEIRRSNFDEWNLHSYWGELRPAGNTPLHNNARFGHSLDFDVAGRTLAVGLPGHRVLGQPAPPRGQLWLYVEDRVFANGFQCGSGLPGC